jgi:magnesium transporter
MIRSLYRARDGHVRTGLEPDAYGIALQDPDGLLWVDLDNEPAEVCEPILRETFGFHPLAVDDALEESHIPKVDDWGEYLYLVLHAVALDEGKGRLDTLELDLFLGKNYLVTHRTMPIAAVDRVWADGQRNDRYLQHGTARLLYRLADELATDYMPVIEGMDEAIDRIEDQVFDDPDPEMLEKIFSLKRASLHLRRIIAPQREVLNKLARGEFFDFEDRVFFRDVYDHLVRMYDITEGLRDLVGGALDTYLSVVNNRMNAVMKILAVITTLFMPISFVAGFFGMNFFQPVTPLGVWTGVPALVLTVAIMAALPAGMFLWMRKRRWT